MSYGLHVLDAEDRSRISFLFKVPVMHMMLRPKIRGTLADMDSKHLITQITVVCVAEVKKKK